MLDRPRMKWFLISRPGLLAAGFGLLLSLNPVMNAASAAGDPDPETPDQSQAQAPPTHKPGERFTIGAPARSNGPDLNQQRWSIQTRQPQTGSASLPNPDPRLGFRSSHFGHGGAHFGLGFHYSDSIYYYPPISGVYSRIDPNLVIHPPKDTSAEAPAPPTATELIFRRAYAEATETLERALREAPDDPERRRLLALARAGERDFADAADQIHQVYAADPDIAVYPLDGDALFDSPLELRRLVVGAVRHAQRSGTARAWLLVAVLMQAEGRDDVAFKMLGRADAQGLDASIVAAWPDPAA